jgi:DNA-binding NtrC family response regulator
VIERSVILSDGPLLEAATLPFDFLAAPAAQAATSLADAEKLHIEKVLHQAKGNKTETARLLGIALTTLYRKLEEYKLQ